MVTKDTALADALLADFTKELTTKFPRDIDYILLTGSLVMGEFKVGESDIDLIVQVKNPKYIEKIDDYTIQLIWDLDKKYNIRLPIERRWNDDTIIGLKNGMFRIVGPDDINWKNGRGAITEKNLFETLDPIHQFSKMFILHVKRAGKILYGRNILDKIATEITSIDIIKIILFHLNIYFILPFLKFFINPDQALKRFAKVLLYTLEAHVTILERPYAKGTTYNMLIDNAGNEGYSTKLLRHALLIRKNPEKIIEWSYLDKLIFLFQIPFHVVYNTFLTFFYYISKK